MWRLKGCWVCSEFFQEKRNWRHFSLMKIGRWIWSMQVQQPTKPPDDYFTDEH
uniref:Uncharacterized protein n=1 Tax=Physcomitrium patens TaxID=3218 RepID=A0A2K1J7F3_PHYPA|nr:hypothetical protein PHYPA_020562 [Physcomitrium patens]